MTYDNSLEKKTVWQFKHESFQKDHPEKLTEIKRRTAKASQEIPSMPTSLPLITTTTDAAAATTDAAASTTTTTEIVQDDTLEEELNKMKLKIQRVDRRRQDLADQVLELSEILTKQKKVRHNYSFIIKNLYLC